MNVLMVIWDYYPGPEGGAERQCRKLVRTLSESGYTCCVLASCHQFTCSRHTKDEGRPVFRIGRFWPVFSRLEFFCRKLLVGSCIRDEKALHTILFWGLLPFRWLARLAFLIELRGFVHSLRPRPDIIHVHESGWLAGVGSWLGKIFCVPVVCKVRNTPALDVIGYDVPFRCRWERLRRTASFIALHETLQAELWAAGISRAHTIVIPNGVDIPSEVVGERDPEHVLYVGNFSQGAAHKGFDILIRAWGIVHRANVSARLTMLGGGDCKRWMVLAEKYLCRASICFQGSTADPAPFYQKASLFVLPSRHEGMSNALLEAQSYGLPAVVSDISANCAIVSDGVNGLLFPSEDYQVLAQHILRLLEDRVMRERMGIAARARMEMLFSMQVVSQALVTFYRNQMDSFA